MKKIVVAGEILVEIMADSVGARFRTPLALTGPFASGAPAIFIDQVARMGQPCGIISMVGNDDFGRLNIERLSSDGAVAELLARGIRAIVHKQGSSGVTYYDQGGHRFVAAFAVQEVDPTGAGDCFGGLSPRFGFARSRWSARSPSPPPLEPWL